MELSLETQIKSVKNRTQLSYAVVQPRIKSHTGHLQLWRREEVSLCMTVSSCLMRDYTASLTGGYEQSMRLSKVPDAWSMKDIIIIATTLFMGRKDATVIQQLVQCRLHNHKPSSRVAKG